MFYIQWDMKYNVSCLDMVLTGSLCIQSITQRYKTATDTGYNILKYTPAAASVMISVILRFSLPKLLVMIAGIWFFNKSP
jgi:hypothetical protein